MSGYKNAPTANRGAKPNYQHNYSLNPLNSVLERVENTRISGEGWRADCPNEHRSRSTLVITEGDDGRALVYCHAGCSVDEIVSSIGLQKQDLFVRQNPTDMTPQQRREYRDKVRLSGWKTALELLPLELRIVLIASQDVRINKPLNDVDQARFELACERLQSAMATLK